MNLYDQFLNKKMNVPKKITILIKNLQNGGAQKVCVTLCNELIKRNYNVELWLLDYEKNSLTLQLHEDVNIIHLQKKKVRDSVFKLVKLFRKHKPAGILIFNIELTILSILIKKIFQVKTLIFFRSINTLSQIFQYPRTNVEKHFTSRLIRVVLPYCDKIVAQSNGMKNDLVSNFNIDEKKIDVIHNPAVNLRQINKQDKVAAIEEKNYFLYVGRLTPQKGLETLIRIFKTARRQIPGIQLLIVGEGPEEEKLKALTVSLEMNSSVVFTGFKQNTSDFYLNAKATVLTSLYEGFPNVLVESIAIGTPVIAFNCPSGPEDIIEPGINGILVPNQDIKAFTEAVISVATDQLQFQKQQVIETSKKFSVETVISQYEAVLNA